MKKLFTMVMAVAFAVGVAQVGYVVAQEKKVEEKKDAAGDKMEKKGDKKMEKKADAKGDKMEKKADAKGDKKMDKKAEKKMDKKDAANPCAAKAAEKK